MTKNILEQYHIRYMAKTLLRIDNVTKQFGSFYANDHINLDLERGRIFGLLGPNGAGKTTLIRMINRITVPDSGTIAFDGNPLADDTIYKIGYLPEERGMYKNMTLRSQVEFFAKLKGVEEKKLHSRLDELFERYGLVHWQDKKIDELSKGMQQKAQFIATIIHQPTLLIFDEPFTGLDPVNTNLIKEEIKAMNEKGATIIFSTHRMEQVEEICQEIALINKGKNILQGTVSDIKQDYKSNRFYLKTDADLSKNDLKSFDIHNIVINNDTSSIEFAVESQNEANRVLKFVIDRGNAILDFHEILPSLNQIFIQAVAE